MTEWQWQVILALCRLVLNAHGVYVYSGYMSRIGDLKKLEEAVERERT